MKLYVDDVGVLARTGHGFREATDAELLRAAAEVLRKQAEAEESHIKGSLMKEGAFRCESVAARLADGGEGR